MNEFVVNSVKAIDINMVKLFVINEWYYCCVMVCQLIIFVIIAIDFVAKNEIYFEAKQGVEDPAT